MSRPKGHKSDHGYSVFADFDGGLGYKEIAQKMTDGGHKMNLSTARNVLISAMESGIHDLLAERANKKDDQTDA